MALTKLNYNGATFSDGLPVTLRFADLVVSCCRFFGHEVKLA
jgi:hypothetical protein